MDRYLVISSDCNAGLPPESYRDYLDAKYRDAFDAALPIQLLAEGLDTEPAGDDLRRGEELVAPAVIPVLVRVHHPASRLGPDLLVVADHLSRVRQVPEGVDHHAPGTVHQSGVAVAESPVLLQAGVDVAGDLS